MSQIPYLTILFLLPLLGGLFITFFVKNKDEEQRNINVKNTTLWISIFTFIWSLIILYNFDTDSSTYQFVEKLKWLPQHGIGYFVGVDGISLSMIILTTLLLPICVLASWSSIKHRVKEFMVLFLLLEAFIIGIFISLDLLMFYIFFEAVLIPMFLIIGIWGGENRIYSAYKLFLYTLAGSVLFLVAMIYIYTQFGTMEIPKLQRLSATMDLDVTKWLWLAFFASFAVKVPMFPFHTWLPDAHVQAPTAGSVILAGVLLKLGAYGFIRISLPFFPEASLYYQDFVFILSVIAIIYTSLIALVQEDMKKLIAYSSVAHMGFVTIGLFSFNTQGFDGAIFQMISHGLVSGALFLCVGVLYERLHTKSLDKMGGITTKMPNFAVLFMVFTMASVGLPGLSGFVGEFLALLGGFTANYMVGILASIGVILGAAYMLRLYRESMYGDIKNDAVNSLQDINITEKLVLGVLAVITIVIGIYPEPVLNLFDINVENILRLYR